jgi:uroporphyrinogen-III decarboxylase
MEDDKKWEELTPAERREERFRRWISPDGVQFASKEAEKNYKARVQRLIDAYSVREPDRVPVSLPVAAWPAYMAGTDLHTVMYDYEKLEKIWKKFNTEFDPDTFASPGMVLPGRVYDLLDYKLYSWPGHGLPLTATGVQFVEGEYMKEDEYEALIRNPSDFWMRIYMPRIFGAFEPWRLLQPFTNIIELPAGHFMPYTRPEVQATQLKLIEVGKELAKWMEVIGGFTQWAMESGYPTTRMVFAKAPFDTIGDTLRGTRGIIKDMFRRPQQLLEGIEVITSLTIEQTISSLNSMNGLVAFFPLHKGADGFMSQEQFDKFYWDSLRRVLLALIDEGILPILFAEGSYNTRLESVNDFPKGAVSWLFDRTDMAKAKKILGGKCCIAGNVPASMMITATAEEVKEYCRTLIRDCGEGGGYILAGGVSIDNGKPDNLRAMKDAAREYGTYR